MSPVVRVFLFINFLVLSVGPKLNANAFSPDAIAILPSPEALLNSITKMGSRREVLLRDSLALFCPDSSTTVRSTTWSGCSLPSDIEAHHELAKKIFFSPNSEIMMHGQVGLSPWDLKHIISLDFTIAPVASNSALGIEAVAELIYRRGLILQKLDLIQGRLGRLPGDLPRLLLVPSLKAHILSASPMGHAISLVKSIQCEKGNVLCHNVKLHISRPIQDAVLKNRSQILELGARLGLFAHSHPTVEAQQLKSLLEFAQSVQDPTANLSLEDLRGRLYDLVSSGQNSFVQDNFQSLARLMIVLAEAQILVEAVEATAPPSIEELGASQSQSQSPFYSKLSQHIQELHGAIAIYGIDLETEEL